MIFRLCCVVALLLNSASVLSQSNTDVLQVKVLKSLNFGTIKAGGISGTISVSANYPTLVSTTGGVYAVSPSHQNPTRLKITGEANTMVFLNLQHKTVLMSENGKALELDLELNSPLRHLGASGVITDVFIGGTLKVDANPSAGDYQGEFSITVDYQ